MKTADRVKDAKTLEEEELDHNQRERQIREWSVVSPAPSDAVRLCLDTF